MNLSIDNLISIDKDNIIDKIDSSGNKAKSYTNS